VLPRVMEAKSRMHMRHLRIWSAGCSTGEEPYTLAIILLEESKSRLKRWTFEVVATDLNPALTRSGRGRRLRRKRAQY
jgi:chemotaxis protein methyltransferase CheR